MEIIILTLISYTLIVQSILDILQVLWFKKRGQIFWYNRHFLSKDKEAINKAISNRTLLLYSLMLSVAVVIFAYTTKEAIGADGSSAREQYFVSVVVMTILIIASQIMARNLAHGKSINDDWLN